MFPLPDNPYFLTQLRLVAYGRNRHAYLCNPRRGLEKISQQPFYLPVGGGEGRVVSIICSNISRSYY